MEKLRNYSVYTVLALAFLSLFAETAAAQSPNGVVLRFEGRGAAKARKAVVAAVQRELTLVDEGEVRSQARELRADLDSAEGRASVARAMELRVLVGGSVEGRGRRARLTLHVYDSLGAEVASRELPASPRGRRPKRAFTNDVREAVQEAIAASPAPAGGGEAEERPVPVPQSSDEESPHSEETVGAGGTDEESVEEEEADAESGEGPPMLVALVGLGFRTRDAEINVVEAGGGDGLREYSVGLFPEIIGRLELRPLVASGSAASGLYFDAEVAHSLGLKSDDETSGEEVDTTAFRFGINAGYLLGLAGGAFEIGPLVGFHYDSFSLGDNGVLPSSTYSQLRLGLAAKVALVGSVLYARADAAYRLVFGTGDLADAFGEDGSVYGLDAGVGIGGSLAVGFSYGVRFSYRTYSLDFSGAASDVQGVDGSDNAVLLAAQVGWSF